MAQLLIEKMSDGQVSTLPDAPRRAHLALAACLLTLLATYGSFVPLEFRSLPWDTAVDNFKANIEFSFSVSRSADWVAHFVLFLLMGYLWLGVLAIDRRSRLVGLIATPFVLAVLIALGVATEFGQQWTANRTASEYDLSADVLGASIGCVLWLLTGQRFVTFARGLTRPASTAGHPSPTRGLLLLYAFGFLLYSLQPFDVTVRPEEISKQFDDHIELVQGSTLDGTIVAQDRFTVRIQTADQRDIRTVSRSNIRRIQFRKVVWRPFSHSYKNVFNAAWQIGSDVLLFIPFGMLFRYRRGVKQAILRTVLLAVLVASLIEFAQLFVISRYLDTTDIFSSAIGAWIGAALAGVFSIGDPAKIDIQRNSTRSHLAVAIGLCLLYTLPLAFIMWHPYKLVGSMDVFLKQLGQMLGVPFRAHYYAGESRALTNLLRSLLLFLPVGALLRWGCGPSYVGQVREGFFLRRLAVIFIAGLMGFVLEAGKAAMQQKHADITDWMIYIIGALLGWWLWGMVTQTHPTSSTESAHRDSQAAST